MVTTTNISTFGLNILYEKFSLKLKIIIRTNGKTGEKVFPKMLYNNLSDLENIPIAIFKP